MFSTRGQENGEYIAPKNYGERTASECDIQLEAILLIVVIKVLKFGIKPHKVSIEPLSFRVQ